MRRLLFLILLLVIVVGLVFWISGPTTTTKTYHPVGMQLVASSSPAPSVHLALTSKQRRICKHYPKRCLSQTVRHYHVAKSKTKSCDGGQVFKMVGVAVGENKLINDIVHGAAIFQACLDPSNPTRFADTWFTWDKHSSWLWAFKGMTVEANHTGWCAECYSQFHYWRLKFEWFHGFDVFGQEIGWHYTNTLACTVRADPVPKGRWSCS